VHRKYRGFTLIELLTVIGIITILVGLLIVGIPSIIGTGGNKSTGVTLKNLQNMTAELETLGPLKSPVLWNWSTGSSITVDITPGTGAQRTWNLDFWKLPYREGGSPTGDPQPLRTYLVSDGSPARIDSPATINTVIAMSRILAVRNNQSALANLPASKLLKVRDAATKSGAGSATLVGKIDSYITDADRYPILLDNWNNPVIYVPATGLGMAGATAVVAANGDVPAGAIKLTAQKAGDQTRVVVSPDGKGFWASAGPDGNFQTGDDNIYSFEQ